MDSRYLRFIQISTASETGVAVMDVDLITRGPMSTQFTTEQIIDHHLEEFKEALVNHATTQFQYQNRLLDEAKHDLEETKRDLEVFKRAFLNAERDKHDLKERFEQEKQALNDEIRRLREPGMHGRAEIFEQVLKDGILQLKAIVTREKRAVHQQNPPPTPANTQQYATVYSGTPTA